MSHEARPISPARFASALEDLPVANLYSKALEIKNSIAHLQRSNEELQAYSDSHPEGDADCLEAIKENDVVIERMRERIDLVKREVEKRGGRWHEADGDVNGINGEEDNGEAGESGHVHGLVDGGHDLDEDAFQDGESGEAGHRRRAEDGGPRQPGGTLDDQELRRRTLERMGEDDDEGMHL